MGAEFSLLDFLDGGPAQIGQDLQALGEIVLQESRDFGGVFHGVEPGHQLGLGLQVGDRIGCAVHPEEAAFIVLVLGAVDLGHGVDLLGHFLDGKNLGREAPLLASFDGDLARFGDGHRSTVDLGGLGEQVDGGHDGFGVVVTHDLSAFCPSRAGYAPIKARGYKN